jgi:methyl-accepting chemotaxis protein
MMSTNVFSDLTLKARIGLGFALVLSMMTVLTIVGIVQVNSISSGLTTIGDVNSVKQRYAINFRGSVHDRAIALRDVILVPNDTELNAVVATITACPLITISLRHRWIKCSVSAKTSPAKKRKF